MIPVRDSGPRLSRPSVLTVILIGLNLGALLLMGAGRGTRFEFLTLRYGLIPGNLTGSRPAEIWQVRLISRAGTHQESLALPEELEGAALERRLRQDVADRLRLRGLDRFSWRLAGYESHEQALPALLTLLTSMFMHGGWGHLIGNMVFLWVFGRRLEDRLGPAFYVVFYLLTGILASASHVVFNTASVVPVVGASGAISGLLGGYVLLWPRGRILTLIPLWPFWQLIELPAMVFVGIWVVMQLLLFPAGGGGVAVWAHLGGFVFGLLLIPLLARAAGPPGRAVPEAGRVRPWGRGTSPGRRRLDDLDWW